MVILSGPMGVPEARSDPQLRRYPLRRLRLPAAGGGLDVVIPDTGAWLHSGGWSQRAQVGAEPPYWADIWPAAVAIARWLCRRPSLAGRRCLDLGCGLGLPGIAAARQGGSVTFADCQPDALAFAVWNARQQAPSASIESVRLDWRTETVSAAFELICLADVTYRPVHHPPVLRHLRRCLVTGGLVVHADPFRRESDGFLTLARREFATRVVTAEPHFGDRRTPVRFHFFAHTADDLDKWLGPPASLTTGDRPADGSANLGTA